jgi:hypothetical protein
LSSSNGQKVRKFRAFLSGNAMAEQFDSEVLRQLMALIMDRLSVQSPGDLAVRLKRTADRPYGVRTVQNWVNGESGPEYASLMTMLSAAGLLMPEAEAAWRGELASEAARVEDHALVQPPEQARPARARAERKRGRQ